MRLVLALVLVALLAPTAGAVALAPLSAARPAAETTDGAGAAAEPTNGGAGIAIIVLNDGAAASLALRLERRDGSVVDERRLEVPAHGRARTDIAAPPADHVLQVESESDGTRVTVRQRVDTTGCDGLYRAQLRIEDGYLSYRPDESGCMRLSARGEALLAEALAAASGRPAPLPIEVPLPRGGDRGAFASGETFADLRSRTTFWWSEEAFLDEWGRAVTDGARASWTTTPGSTCGAGVTVFGTGTSNAATTEGAVEGAAYAPGRFAPVSVDVAGCSAAIMLASDGLRHRAVTHTQTLFGPWTPHACMARHGLQGQSVVAGQRFTADDVCGGWTRGREGHWIAGDRVERDGFTAVPLHFLDASPEGVLVARVWLAHGIAYPLEAEWHFVSVDRPLTTGVARLEGLETDGKPVRGAGDALQPPAPAPRILQPLHPLHGPVLDTARGRFPFPLDEAARAALADPALRDLQALAARDGALLKGAALRAREDAGLPVASDVWYLLFAAPGATDVSVVCQRPRVAPLAPPPLARCSQAPHPFDLQTAFAGAPAELSAATLPAAALAFDDAAARWDALAPDRAASSVTYVLYRPWSKEEQPPVLVVGHGYPQNLAPADIEGTREVSLLRTHLFDGHTLGATRGLERAAGLGTLPDALAPPAMVAPAASAPGAPVAALAAGSVLTIGLVGALVLFWGALKSAAVALFSRLVRPRVLDAESRARIHDLVLAEPGIHAREVAQRLGRAGGVTDYHLDVLVREGFLTCLETPGFRRYFVTGRFSATEMRALGALREGQAEKLYRLVEAHPGIHLMELADRAGVSLSYASKTVKRLSEAGLVDQEKVGRAVRIHPLER